MSERIESVVALRFGAFEVDLVARELRKNGVSLKLQEKPFQILELLVTRAGEVVIRKDIQERLWPHSFVCFDRSINTGVNKLRQTLGDSVRHPRYIETRSRRGYRFIAPVEPAGVARASVGQRGEGIDSIAVLPFQNAGASPEMEYLSDGITESIINTLSQLPGIRVMARITVFRYKGRGIDPQNVGRDLRTRAVLTGRVAQRDGNLAIDAELVDVDNGWRLWGEQFNVKASDILAVQGEISKKISEGLPLGLNGDANRRRLEKPYPEGVEATRDYLSGHHYRNKMTKQGSRTMKACHFLLPRTGDMHQPSFRTQRGLKSDRAKSGNKGRERSLSNIAPSSSPLSASTAPTSTIPPLGHEE